MAEFEELKATAREQTGKGAARAMRREGRVPGIIYGDQKPPKIISLDYNDVWQTFRTGTFLSTVYTVVVDGAKTRVIPRDIQLDPVRGLPTHVDFLRLSEGATIIVGVPVTFLNEEESPGLKRGGVLNVVRHTIEMRCPAESIPETIKADLTGLEIGDSLHISDIELPEDVKLTIADRDFTVATIAGRMAEIVEEVEEEEEEFEEGLKGEIEGEETPVPGEEEADEDKDESKGKGD